MIFWEDLNSVLFFVNLPDERHWIAIEIEYSNLEKKIRFTYVNYLSDEANPQKGPKMIESLIGIISADVHCRLQVFRFD